MMNLRLFLSLPLLLGSTAMAQTVSEGEALDKALDFLTSHQHAHGAQADVRLTLAHKAAMEGETYYYVFNNQAGGFVIIGGDEVADDVLGYAEDGAFDIDQLPPAFRWWLSTYEQSISQGIRARQGNHALSPRAPKQAPAAQPNITSMITTQWNQDMPYNALIPGNTPSTPYDDQYATGCVATAVAQLMKYHQWPEHGWSSKRYELNGYTYEADFTNSTYHWNLMRNTYNGYTGSAADMEVAKLMYHVGVSVGMNYGTVHEGGSAASIYTAIRSLATYFGYEGGQYTERSDMSDRDWESLIYEELSNHRPVLYSGRDADGGHAFICDGYKNGKFHINWGWGGYCDGIYNLTPTSTEDALDPNGSGIGGAGEGSAYKGSQSIVTGLRPNRAYDGGLNVLDIVMPYDGAYIKGEPFEIEFVLENSSSTSRSIDDPTLFVYPGEGGSSIGYLDGPKGFVVEPHSTRSLAITSGGSVPDWMKTTQKLIMQLMDYTDRTRYVQFNITICPSLSFDYTLSNDGWGTLCLPFSAEVPEGLNAYVVTGIRANESLIRSRAARLEMNKAYLISGTPGTYHFFGPETEQGVYQNGLLWGVTKKTGEYAPSGSYALQNKSSDGVAFYKVTMPYSYRIQKYNAYLSTPTPMGTRILIGEETGIHNVVLDDDETTQMLNIMGQRTEAATGLIIKNGKLLFVR